MGKKEQQIWYANYPKDYFMGMLPSSQYGSVAVMPSSYYSTVPSSYIIAAAKEPPTNQGNSLLKNSSGSSVVTDAAGTNRSVLLNSDLSALSIRATEYLQRWKEVVQFSSKDYSDQMADQFGVKAPEYMGNHNAKNCRSSIQTGRKSI